MTLAAQHTYPDQATFARLHRIGRSLPLWIGGASAEDPIAAWDALDLVRALPDTTSTFLLETPGGPDDLEQRTFLAWDPEWELSLRNGVLQRRTREGSVTRERCDDPLQALRRCLAAEGANAVPYEDGFSGGLVGYVSYEFKNWLERLPDTTLDDLETPELRLAFVRHVVAWDRKTSTVTFRVQHRCRSKRAATDWLHAQDAVHAFRDRVARFATQRAKVASASAPPRPAAHVQGAPHQTSLRSNLERHAYDAMLAQAREHILAGDIYQANLSHRFEADYSGEGAALYERLRQINPSPFATYMRFPEHELVSCSPERLVRLHRGRVETRPIAGTRPRGGTSHEDDSLERELLANEKERAEHLMIVDMARNDIGRVCELGSVHVDSFMHVERYSHVRHLVSNVVGTLRGHCDAFDVLAGTFPGASITGVPKVRCMEIIDELEEFKRGVYTGSAGYFGLDGDMDLNILIRTFFVQDGRAYYNVGGGIVADSNAEAEYHETLAKGRALFDALCSAGTAGDTSKKAHKKSGSPARPGSKGQPRSRGVGV